MPLQAGISNPAGVYGLPLAGTLIGGQVVMTNDGVFIEYINNSGAALQYGAVVVTDPTGLLATTTTTLGDLTVMGVVSQYSNLSTTLAGAPAVPSGAPMMVQVRGVARVWVINTNPIIIGTPIQSSVTAGRATGNATAITVATAQATFGIALEAFAAADTNSTIRVKLV